MPINNPTSIEVEVALKGKSFKKDVESFCREFIILPNDIEVKNPWPSGERFIRIKGTKRFWTLNDEGKWEHA